MSESSTAALQSVHGKAVRVDCSPARLVLGTVIKSFFILVQVSSLGSRTVFNAVLAIVSTWIIVASLAVPIWMAHHLKVRGLPYMDKLPIKIIVTSSNKNEHTANIIKTWLGFIFRKGSLLWKTLVFFRRDSLKTLYV